MNDSCLLNKQENNPKYSTQEAIENFVFPWKLMDQGVLYCPLSKQRTVNHWGSFVYSWLHSKIKTPLRIPPKRTKPHKFSQIISQKIGKIRKIDYPISDSSKGLGNTKRPIQHTLVHQLSGETPFIVIHPLVWAWKGVRHRVSDSVFKVKRIIE